MGERSSIEWDLIGPCPNGAGKCDGDFSLYIYKDCDPRISNCKSTKADTTGGSQKHVSIANPKTGSKYYALIYVKNGSGSFTLTAKSYSC